MPGAVRKLTARADGDGGSHDWSGHSDIHKFVNVYIAPRNLPDGIMLLIIGIVLLVAWLLGFLLMKKVVGGLIHILLIIALIAILIHFLGAGGAHIS